MIKLSYSILVVSAAFNISSWICEKTNQKIEMKYHVTGTIMQTQAYCGGAQPTQAMMDSSKTPRAIPFGKLFIKPGTENKETESLIDSIVADVEGNFSIDLPAGDYCLVEEWKYKPLVLPLDNENQKVDAVCYGKLYGACDFNLNITNKNIEQVKIIFHRSCFFYKPCISYRGPLPHTAPPQ